MGGEEYREARARLVDGLERGDRLTDERVAEALRAVPRHEFVPEGHRGDAYADRPLPIGGGQTISAPHMVGRMCELLNVEPGDRALEVGTGCGYHAAVTAELGAEVYSVEYDPALAEAARDRLARLGYGLHLRQGDGREGWPEHAPYDAAYLTCAADAIPEPVVEQVRPGGRLLAPVRDDCGQDLVLATRREDGPLDRESHGGVRFVEMRGD